jgi:hypothetical protein
LIEDYLLLHSDLSDWHRALSHYHAATEYIFEARAHGGSTSAAIRHLDAAIVAPPTPGKPAEYRGPADWNALVTATKAFLLGDRATLIAVSKSVAAMPKGSVKFPGFAEDMLQHIGEPYGSWWKE